MEADKPKNLQGESGSWRPRELMVNSSLKVNRHNTQKSPRFSWSLQAGQKATRPSLKAGRIPLTQAGSTFVFAFTTSACFSFASLTENRQDSGTALPKSALALKGRQGGMTSQRFPEVSNLPPRPKEVVSDYRVL